MLVQEKQLLALSSTPSLQLLFLSTDIQKKKKYLAARIYLLLKQPISWEQAEVPLRGSFVLRVRKHCLHTHGVVVKDRALNQCLEVLPGQSFQYVKSCTVISSMKNKRISYQLTGKIFDLFQYYTALKYPKNIRHIWSSDSEY